MSPLVLYRFSCLVLLGHGVVSIVAGTTVWFPMLRSPSMFAIFLLSQSPVVITAGLEYIRPGRRWWWVSAATALSVSSVLWMGTLGVAGLDLIQLIIRGSACAVALATLRMLAPRARTAHGQASGLV